MKNSSFLGLSERNCTILCRGISVFVCLMGIRVVLSPNFALKMANTQLTVNSSADELDLLAKRLKEQAQILEQKDAAYQQLQATYEDYLKHKKGTIELGKRIEAIDELPEVSNIDEIEADISQVEEELLEVTE